MLWSAQDQTPRSTIITSFRALALTGLLWTGPTVALATQDAQIMVSARPAERQVTLTGFTRAQAVLALVAATSGRVLEVTANVGDSIGEAGVFAHLDPTFIGWELEANQVEQARLRARVTFDQGGTERYRTLTDQGSASPSPLETVEHTLTDNRFELRNLAVSERMLQERRQRTRVDVPAGWHIVERRVEPGQWANVGEVLGKAADLRVLLVRFGLTPDQYAALQRMEDTLVLWLPDLQRQVAAEGLSHATPPAFLTSPDGVLQPGFRPAHGGRGVLRHATLRGTLCRGELRQSAHHRLLSRRLAGGRVDPRDAKDREASGRGGEHRV